jgi:hypothetical protein
MPASDEVRARLAAPLTHDAEAGDRLRLGDYGGALFSHDASEASIELLGWPALAEASIGALSNLLDLAHPSGRVHRTELPHKARDLEPSRPVLAQWAERAAAALGERGLAWLDGAGVFRRVLAALGWFERELTGPHGLILTFSARQSGFDSDLLTAHLPERTVEGPDQSAFMVLEYQAAARMADALGDAARANELREKAERLAALIEALLWWEDERGGFYTGLTFVHGAASLAEERVTLPGPRGARPVESWVGLLPLYAGIPSPARAEALIRRLTDPEGYWGPAGVRTAPAWDPFFHQAPRVLLWDPPRARRGPVSNWSGPVWVLSSYYLAEGLARYGRQDLARALAVTTARVLADDLAACGRLHECHDDRGRGLWPAAGPSFISWNVLALTMLRRHAPSLLPAEARWG